MFISKVILAALKKMQDINMSHPSCPRSLVSLFLE